MIEIKSRWTNEVLYRSESAETLRDAVIEAVQNSANLDGASLVRANLVRANLDRANLVRANLDGANLDGASLDGANLVRANLVRANLDRANLDGANLDGASLDGASLNFNPNLAGVISDMNFIQVGGIGSSKRMTTYCIQMDMVWCGCFTGSLAGFEAKFERTHAYNDQFLAEYRAAIVFFKSVRDLVATQPKAHEAEQGNDELPN